MYNIDIYRHIDYITIAHTEMVFLCLKCPGVWLSNVLTPGPGVQRSQHFRCQIPCSSFGVKQYQNIRMMYLRERKDMKRWLHETS